MSDRLDVQEFIAGYLAEAEELLSSSRAGLVAIDQALQKKENHPKAVRELFRSLHTLKGLSAMVGAEPIVDIAHELETLLRSSDKAGGKIPPRALDEILKALSAIEERVGCLNKGEPLAPAPKALIEALAALQFDARAERPSGRLSLDPEILLKLSLAEQEQLLQGLSKGSRALRVDFTPSQERASQGINITSVRARVGALGELVKVLPRSIPSQGGKPGSVAFVLILLTKSADSEVAQAAASEPDQVHSIALVPEAAPTGLDADFFEEAPAVGEAQKHNFVRVDVARLDDALEGLSALVVTRSRLQRAVKALAEGQDALRDLTNILVENGRQLRSLRGAIMRARMIRVEEMLDRVPLLIRGLSRSSKKQVRLTIDAGASELDKAVADRIFPAVVHLLRNAVDHAMELPEERKAKGKPEEGHIQVTCANRSASQLALTVSDDGRGIDRENVARRASSPVPQDDVQLLGLITRPGLSTMDQATHLSGRGLGMDIVKRIVVDELGGELQLGSQPNVGTRFTLIIPLSVTILDVFSFSLGDRTFVVPVSAVEDLAEVAPGSVTHAPSPKQGGSTARLFQYRGGALPLLTLGSLLGVPSQETERPKAIIVRKDAERFAFQVDRMMGQQEVVVRPLRDPLVSVRGISGSTDLGDGRPTLVLDLLSLAQRASAGKEAVTS